MLCAAAAGMLVPPAGDSHLPPSSPGAGSDALAESTFLFWVLAPCKWAIAPVLVALLYIVPRLLVTWELMSSEELFLALPLQTQLHIKSIHSIPLALVPSAISPPSWEIWDVAGLCGSSTLASSWDQHILDQLRGICFLSCQYKN